MEPRTQQHVDGINTADIEHLDVLIIGAGISGLGMCHTLMQTRPQDSFAVIESRDNFGGTWDLFRYPGIRSDSDMYTFAYSFKPWREREYIGSAERIRHYLLEFVEEQNLRPHIRFSQRVVSASWDSAESLWTCSVVRGDESIYRIRCRFLVTCTGYYNYARGYLPKFKGYDSFNGDILHPQQWPQDYDYQGKRVIVIGSGATAVTLVPSMALKAAHVTMLQRSPSYIYNRPSRDGLFRFLSGFLPAGLTNRIMRIKYILMQQMTYFLSKRFPDFMRRFLQDSVRKVLADPSQADSHFTPHYKPWDQRVCMVPDNDMFDAINAGKASVVTAEIDSFNAGGIRLRSGEQLDADLIVPATGLDIQLWGGMDITVDGQPVVANSLSNYKGMMFSNVPNLVTIFGYTNASWTLKAELSFDYVCRLLDYMQKNRHSAVYPYLEKEQESEGLVDLTSGYIMRAMDRLPKQGLAFPWRNKDFYLKDLVAIKYQGIADGVLRFDDTEHLCHFHQQVNANRADNDKGEAA